MFHPEDFVCTHIQSSICALGFVRLKKLISELDVFIY